MSEHVLREIEKLKKHILTLSAMVEDSVHMGVRSVNEKDKRLAQKVIDGDIAIDQMEVDVEEECLKILALYQPVAIDLRFVVAVLKINSDLERVGDLAVNMAERAVFLAVHDLNEAEVNFSEMFEKVQTMLRRSLDAMMTMDTQLARTVCASDDEVDEMNRKVFSMVNAAILRDPTRVEALIHLLSVARHLERIADYATNIAEEVIYMIDGEIIRHRVEVYISEAQKRQEGLSQKAS